MKMNPKTRKLIAAGLLLLLGFVTLNYIVPLAMPMPEGLVEPEDPSTVITDRNGVPLRRFLVNDEEVVSAFATLDEIPDGLINATISAEDKRFHAHNGVDPVAIVRAMIGALKNGRAVSGASTITQQLVKISSPPRGRTLKTKVVEVFTARKVEMKLTKEEILENYLNRLPYGNLRTGCRTASEGYFGKPLHDLSHAECAFLAGLPNKPTRFNPYKNFRGAKNRQLWILDRMLEDGFLTDEQYERAKTEKLVIVEGASVFRAPHAVDLMVQTRREALHPGVVQSTLDMDMQRYAEDAIDRQLAFITGQRHVSPYLHAAVVVIENATGNVRVLTGSRDYFSPQAGQVNGAWARRSPGSTLKPFTYLLALEQGFSPSSILADVPTEFMTPGGMYRPVNYDHTFRGPVRMRFALANSLNIPAVRMLELVGGPPVLFDTLQKLGFTDFDRTAADYGLGLTIGNAEVRLLELTNAYACIARLGEWKDYHLLADEPQEEPVRVFSEDSCYLIADMLSDPAARAQVFGWNSPLRVDGITVAAKTGTSSDYRDAWTLGFTPEFTVGVWLGNFDNSSMDKFSGSAGAGPIFNEVMTKLHETTSATWYDRPNSITEVRIDPSTGKRIDRNTHFPFRLPRTEKELSPRSSLPMSATVSDYDAGGRPLLKDVYRPWYESSPKTITERFAMRPPDQDEDQPFEITSPLSGMTIYLDPDMAHQGRRLRLSTTNASSVEWISDTLQIDEEASIALLVPGEHELTAEDPATGYRQSVRIHVQSL